MAYHCQEADSLLREVRDKGRLNMTAAKKAFVLMPFRKPYESYYSAIFRPALETAGYEVSRADDFLAPWPIMMDIQKSIIEADLILCELSEKTQMYSMSWV